MLLFQDDNETPVIHFKEWQKLENDVLAVVKLTFAGDF